MFWIFMSSIFLGILCFLCVSHKMLLHIAVGFFPVFLSFFYHALLTINGRIAIRISAVKIYINQVNMQQKVHKYCILGMHCFYFKQYILFYFIYKFVRRILNVISIQNIKILSAYHLQKFWIPNKIYQIGRTYVWGRIWKCCMFVYIYKFFVNLIQMCNFDYFN